ncbi:hypothetical protein CRM22_009461 [Opisthorchis felineus]|uniref:ZP domain-containing protein n=1 Tax=Opisthorchis felineus TaxID=147828 RepID=A0A4S2L7I7_OPIFE|nr:hypothetical protein CRM22_009461 [Opisthorchis felineus]
MAVLIRLEPTSTSMLEDISTIMLPSGVPLVSSDVPQCDPCLKVGGSCYWMNPAEERMRKIYHCACPATYAEGLLGMCDRLLASSRRYLSCQGINTSFEEENSVRVESPVYKLSQNYDSPCRQHLVTAICNSNQLEIFVNLSSLPNLAHAVRSGAVWFRLLPVVIHNAKESPNVDEQSAEACHFFEKPMNATLFQYYISRFDQLEKCGGYIMRFPFDLPEKEHFKENGAYPILLCNMMWLDAECWEGFGQVMPTYLKSEVYGFVFVVATYCRLEGYKLDEVDRSVGLVCSKMWNTEAKLCDLFIIKGGLVYFTRLEMQSTLSILKPLNRFRLDIVCISTKTQELGNVIDRSFPPTVPTNQSSRSKDKSKSTPKKSKDLGLSIMSNRTNLFQRNSSFMMRDLESSGYQKTEKFAALQLNLTVLFSDNASYLLVEYCTYGWKNGKDNLPVYWNMNVGVEAVDYPGSYARIQSRVTETELHIPCVVFKQITNQIVSNSFILWPLMKGNQHLNVHCLVRLCEHSTYCTSPTNHCIPIFPVGKSPPVQPPNYIPGVAKFHSISDTMDTIVEPELQDTSQAYLPHPHETRTENGYSILFIWTLAAFCLLLFLSAGQLVIHFYKATRSQPTNLKSRNLGYAAVPLNTEVIDGSLFRPSTFPRALTGDVQLQNCLSCHVCCSHSGSNQMKICPSIGCGYSPYSRGSTLNRCAHQTRNNQHDILVISTEDVVQNESPYFGLIKGNQSIRRCRGSCLLSNCSKDTCVRSTADCFPDNYPQNYDCIQETFLFSALEQRRPCTGQSNTSTNFEVYGHECGE